MFNAPNTWLFRFYYYDSQNSFTGADNFFGAYSGNRIDFTRVSDGTSSGYWTRAP